MESDINKFLHDTVENSIVLEDYLLNGFGKLNEKKNILLEKHGMIPNVEQYINVFINFLKKHKDSYGKFILKQNNFNKIENCFFSNVDIVVNKQEKGGNGGYLVGNNFGLNEDDKINTLRMNFTLSGKDWNGFVNRARNLFAHELTHAYEIYMRLKKGQRPYTADDYISSYITANDLKDSSNSTSLEKKIGYIVYYLFDFETNAYAASLYTSLLYGAPKWATPQDGLKQIEENVTFNNYKIIYNWIEEIANTNNKNDVEEIWLQITKKRLSYNKIIKKMTSLYYKRWNQLRKVIAKVCLDAFENSRKTPFKNEEIDLRTLF